MVLGAELVANHRFGIYEMPENTDPKVEVGSGGPAGGPGQPDGLSPGDVLACCHLDRGQVKVHADYALAVVDID